MHALRIFAIAALMGLLPMTAKANQVGAAAPDFSLPDVKGTPVSLEQFKGEVVFLSFWAPWCDACREEIPSLDSLYRKYADSGLVIIGIDMDDSMKLANEFLRKTPVSFPILIDGKGAARRAYRIRNLPAAYLVGRDGVVRYVHLGFGSEFVPIYEQEITELLKQK